MRKLTALLSLGTFALMATEGALARTEAAPEAAMGLTGKVALVHKKDAEGALQIDANTGQVLPEQHDRPEWAEGLILAMLAERHTFYTSRLGDKYAKQHALPEVYAFEDLTWLAIREDAATEQPEEYVLDADAEFRMEVIANVLGIDRSEDADEATQFGKKASFVEAYIGYDNTRTGEQMKAFTEAQEKGTFGEVRKTGTAG